MFYILHDRLSLKADIDVVVLARVFFRICRQADVRRKVFSERLRCRSALMESIEHHGSSLLQFVRPSRSACVADIDFQQQIDNITDDDEQEEEMLVSNHISFKHHFCLTTIQEFRRYIKLCTL